MCIFFLTDKFHIHLVWFVMTYINNIYKLVGHLDILEQFKENFKGFLVS